MKGWHWGRSWTGHPIEDKCPCEKAPCGLVVPSPDVECDQHNGTRTMRQSHAAESCPGRAG